jgi:hypothetical protein
MCLIRGAKVLRVFCMPRKAGHTRLKTEGIGRAGKRWLFAGKSGCNAAEKGQQAVEEA